MSSRARRYASGALADAAASGSAMERPLFIDPVTASVLNELAKV